LKSGRQDPAGAAVAAFWMLADDGGGPPEIDVMEGRGQRPGDIVMTTHWRIRNPEDTRLRLSGAGCRHRVPRLWRAAAG
jgi:hypothetical protein